MSESLKLQLELLRMRGEVQRTEVVAAFADMRTGTRRFGAIAATVSSIGGVLAGAKGGWLGATLEALGVGLAGARSLWAAPLALAAARIVRRHPVAAIALAAGALAVVGLWLGRRKPRAD